MSDILAYFLTWTTYGTWLPGDARGWVHHSGGGIQAPDPPRQKTARKLMKDDPVRLDEGLRSVVQDNIIRSCTVKGWKVHALNVLPNHVHIVVSADNVAPEKAMSFLKAWASRALNDIVSRSRAGRWWTRHGSTRYIKTFSSLEKAIQYVRKQ